MGNHFNPSDVGEAEPPPREQSRVLKSTDFIISVKIIIISLLRICLARDREVANGSCGHKSSNYLERQS